MEWRSGSAPRSDQMPESQAAGTREYECEWADLEVTLREFRDSARAAAELPGSFWDEQRAAVSRKLQKPAPARWRRPALLWAPAAAVVVLCLFLFVKDGSAPTPDFAGGADQDLLVGVEQATDQKYPRALEPAALLTQEMEEALKTPGP